MIYLGYAKSGKEFEVVEDLEQLGIWTWCGRVINWRRTGKKRFPEPHEEPALPNYLFMDLTAEEFHKALGVRFLASTLVALARIDMKGFNKFCHVTDKEFRKQDKLRQSQEVPVSEFNPGEELLIIGGPFADKLATFRRVIERAHEMHPKLEAEISGIRVQLDPLDVKAAQ